MSKSVLISIQPKWCSKIANGEKTIEVRKTKPKIRTPFKCYIYCTKPAYPYENVIIISHGFSIEKAFYCGRKVIGEFVCDKIIKVNCDSVDLFDDETKQYIGKECCLNVAEYHKYTLFNSFGWHISELKIYDEPKTLSEFRTYNPGVVWEYGYPVPTHEIKRPPQSWCYVEEIE